MKMRRHGRVQDCIMITGNDAVLTRPAVVPVLNEDDIVVDDLLVYKRGARLKLDDFFSRSIVKRKDTGLILPKGCRMVESSSSSDDMVLVIEDEPQMRTITVDMSLVETCAKLEQTGKLEEYGFKDFLENHPEPPYQFQLYFPYMVYIITIRGNQWSGMRPFMRLQPITGKSDYLLQCPLPNISGSDGTLCPGDMVEPYAERGSVISEVNDAKDRFWFNTFNTDYIEHYTQYRGVAFVSDYLTWAYNSHKDPMFVFDVKWIPYENTLGQVVKLILSNTSNNRIDDIRYRCHEAFQMNEVVSTEESDAMVRSITDSIYLPVRQNYLTVGESIVIDDEQLYVYSFLGKGDGTEPTHMECEDQEGLIKTIEITAAISYQISINMDRYEGLWDVTIDGQKLEKGDIIKLKYPFEAYKRIDSIVKFKEGNIEIKSGNDFFMLENIKFDKFDGVVSLHGVTLGGGEIYFIGGSRFNNSATILKRFQAVTFDGVDFSQGKMTLAFKKDGEIYTRIIASDRNDDVELVEYEKIEKPIVLRFHTRILHNHLPAPTYGYTDRTIFQFGMSNSGGSNIEDMIDSILLNDKTELFIPSYDFDIHYCIDDKIIYVDWTNPKSMHTILRIKEFDCDYDSDFLYIIAENGRGEEITIPYIDLDSRDIDIGCVRSVVLEYGDWKTGDKIKAAIPGIQEFPKCDTNIIIGFLNDTNTKYPLVLLSNLCTQWMDDSFMENFHHLKKGTKAWNKHKPTYRDPSKIRLQSGDFLKDDDTHRNRYGDRLYLVAKEADRYNDRNRLFTFNKRLARYETEYINDSLESYVPDRFHRHGIITPRYSRKIQNLMPGKVGWPNLYGGYNFDNDSILGFKERWDYV